VFPAAGQLRETLSPSLGFPGIRLWYAGASGEVLLGLKILLVFTSPQADAAVGIHSANRDVVSGDSVDEQSAVAQPRKHPAAVAQATAPDLRFQLFIDFHDEGPISF
jgi:hypothetical protein